MKKSILFSIILLCIVRISHAQQIPQVYQHTLMGGANIDYFTSVQRNPLDSSIVMFGYTKSNTISGHHGDFDFWVVKLTVTGDTVFSKAFGTTNSEVCSKGIILPNGEYLVVGSISPFPFNGTVPNDYKGNGDIFVVKIDRQGDLVWQKCIGGTSGEIVDDIILGPSGSCILTGVTQSTNGAFINCPNRGSYDAFVVSINDTTGNVLSVKTFGGSNQDHSKSITACSDGTYALAGWTLSIDGDVSGNHLDSGYVTSDIWIAKINQNFDLLWQRCIGTNLSEYGCSVVEGSSGNLFVSGKTIPYPVDSITGDLLSVDFRGEEDGFIACVDGSGILLWAKTYGGSANDYELFLKKNPYTNSIFAYGITVSADMQVPNNAGTEDVWMFIFNENDGSLVSAISFGQSGHDVITDIVPLAMNNFIAVGAYTVSDYSVPWQGLVMNTSETFQPRVPFVITSVSQPQSSIGQSKLYPNPTSGIVHMTIPDDAVITMITIYNLSGQVLFSEQTSDSIYTTDLTQFAQGTYIVEIKSDTQLFQQRVQKL